MREKEKERMRGVRERMWVRERIRRGSVPPPLLSKVRERRYYKLHMAEQLVPPLAVPGQWRVHSVLGALVERAAHKDAVNRHAMRMLRARMLPLAFSALAEEVRPQFSRANACVRALSGSSIAC
eukprot:6174170-Pleurochrysis_carterae.AAC.1